MTKSYSLDLRRRVARFVEAGHSCHEAARHFEVSVAFVVRLMAAYRSTSSLAPQPEGGWRSSKLDPHREFLLQRVAEKGDITMPNWPPNCWPSARRSPPLRSRTGTAARATASNKTRRASEQGRSDVRQAREHWPTRRQPRMQQEPHRLVFRFAALRVSMRPAPPPR
jgi:hypothetical protein